MFAGESWGRVTGGIQGAWVSTLVLLVLVGFHFVALYSPQLRGLPQPDEAQRFLFVLWEVSGAVLGIAFVILIFVVDTMHRSTAGGLAWSQFLRQRGPYFVTALVVGTIGAVGYGAFALYATIGPQQGLLNLVVLDSLLFGASLLAVLWIYFDIFRLLNPVFVHNLAIDSIAEVVRDSLAGTLRERLRDYTLQQQCAPLDLLTSPGSQTWPGMEPVRTESYGTVNDIDLNALRDIASALRTAAAEKPFGVVNLTIGTELTPDSNVVFLVRTGHANETIRRRAERGFRLQ